jgi:uncharacterized membrane protein
MKSFRLLITIFFSIFLLFSSGFIYEIVNDRPSSFALDRNVQTPNYYVTEVSAAKWSSRAVTALPIYADIYHDPLMTSVSNVVFNLQGGLNVSTLLPFNMEVPKNSYIFLGYQNIHTGQISLYSIQGKVDAEIRNITLYHTLEDNSKIFDNGDANLYLDSGS